jgi:hypothetical protein
MEEKILTRHDHSGLTDKQVFDKYLEAKRWASYDNLSQAESDKWSLLRDDYETEMINRSIKY